MVSPGKGWRPKTQGTVLKHLKAGWLAWDFGPLLALRLHARWPQRCPPPAAMQRPLTPGVASFPRRRPPDVWTHSPGPVFHPESFFGGPGAR